ncbi:thioesterase family protein [Aequorivita sp. SDUM287046]|uniref:Thioesterase family protein n=1 Tax=Aequorivita aurantiaca TaxID=3053356 RepID=A0ABT8DID6_9FLAO|nr:thioesterase family protein [Aequorivita aurantiaca]MDN3722963.1 thioesterase family protein [Aequorivita aurantiaca]
MYIKQFEIRWSDVDANRHLRNSAYIDYMSHTRMGFLMENGLNQKQLSKYDLGPVAFYEHMYYFREVFPGKPVRVSLQLKGISEDGMYFRFLHNFYDENGKNFARCEMMGGWIDLKERKLVGLPKELFDNFEALEKTADFKILTKEDTRKYNERPKDL